MLAILYKLSRKHDKRWEKGRSRNASSLFVV